MLASSGIQMDYEPMNLTVVANTPGEKRKAEEEESGESPEGEPKR